MECRENSPRTQPRRPCRQSAGVSVDSMRCPQTSLLSLYADARRQPTTSTTTDAHLATVRPRRHSTAVVQDCRYNPAVASCMSWTSTAAVAAAADVAVAIARTVAWLAVQEAYPSLDSGLPGLQPRRLRTGRTSSSSCRVLNRPVERAPCHVPTTPRSPDNQIRQSRQHRCPADP